MDHTIVFHLIKAAKRIQNELGLKSSEYRISASEASALLIIDSQKDTSQIDIALKLHLKPASIVALIDDLEELKLVTRRTTMNDRRKYQIKLTEKGKTEVKKIRDKTNEIEAAIRKKLTKKEVNMLLYALEKLSTGPIFKLEPIHHQTKRKEVKNEQQLPGTKPFVAS